MNECKIKNLNKEKSVGYTNQKIRASFSYKFNFKIKRNFDIPPLGKRL